MKKKGIGFILLVGCLLMIIMIVPVSTVTFAMPDVQIVSKQDISGYVEPIEESAFKGFSKEMFAGKSAKEIATLTNNEFAKNGIDIKSVMSAQIKKYKDLLLSATMDDEREKFQNILNALDRLINVRAKALSSIDLMSDSRSDATSHDTVAVANTGHELAVEAAFAFFAVCNYKLSAELRQTVSTDI